MRTLSVLHYQAMFAHECASHGQDVRVVAGAYPMDYYWKIVSMH